MNMQFDDWLKSTRQSYQDPTMWDGEVDWCKRCDSEPKYEDTDVCNSCIEELEEMRNNSLCCGDLLCVDKNRCTSCYEWSESEFENFCETENFNPKTYKYA